MAGTTKKVPSKMSKVTEKRIKGSLAKKQKLKPLSSTRENVRFASNLIDTVDREDELALTENKNNSAQENDDYEMESDEDIGENQTKLDDKGNDNNDDNDDDSSTDDDTDDDTADDDDNDNDDEQEEEEEIYVKKEDDEDEEVELNTDNELQSDTINEFENASLAIPSITKIAKLFQNKEMKQLSKILKNVQNKLPSDISYYKSLVDSKEKKADRLIKQLFSENQELRASNTELKSKIRDVKKDNRRIIKALQSEISRSKNLTLTSNERTKELEAEISTFKCERIQEAMEDDDIDDDDIDINITPNTTHLDENYQFRIDAELEQNFFELLTGINYIKCEETNEIITFTIKQRGTMGILYYKLTINKILEGKQYILYDPIWTQPADFEGDWEVNVEKVKSALADYLHKSLSFPANTIILFHNKVSSNLN